MRFIKCILLIAALLGFRTVAGHAAGLVNNVGATSEDRRSWTVQNWDSTGTRRVAADSFFVLCFGPDGDSAYAVRLDTSATSIRSFRSAGDTLYTYSDWVANLDGAGVPGVYILEVRALQIATQLSYANTFEFQIIGIDFDGGLIDTVLNKDSVLVSGIGVNVITDASIEPNAIDLDEFGGTLGPLQLEPDLLTSSSLHGSAAREIADTLRHDSLIYQGSGSSAATIADFVWDEVAAGHTAPGTFGSYLDARVSQVAGGGSGTYACTLWVAVNDSAPMLPGVAVQVQNGTGAIVASGRTQADGSFVAYLDNGSWAVTANAIGWSVETVSLPVSGAGTHDTLAATLLDPGQPASPTLCRVYGYVYDVAGDSIAGAQVTARLIDGPARLNGYLIRPSTAAVSTDAAGYFAIDLIPNAVLSPAGSRYEISATLSDGVMIRSVVTVPDQASWQIVW